MPKKAAIEIMVLNPDPDVHHHRQGVHENLWIKERFGKDNYLSIGVMLKEGTSELQFYFFEDGDKKPHPQFYSSLKALQEDLPPEKKNIFDRAHKVYLMGHGDAESKYGFGNYHAHDDFSHPPNNTEQIYGDEFDKLINEILRTIPTHNEIGITLEQCHADNLVTSEKGGYTRSFLERLSANYPHVTFSGTGPWSDSKDLQESLATDSRASGGYPDLHTPVTSTGGGIWKHGNTVIFHHNGVQIAVKKSPFSSTETAKNLKINTVNYAREILNQKTNLKDGEKDEIITRIRASRDIHSIDDLKYQPAFPYQTESSSEKITKLVENEKIILKQEQDRYLQRVHAILSQDKHSDRDVLMIALGLNHRFIFNGHDDILQMILANVNLLKLVMVTCGKVLLGAQNNNSAIDLLLKRGISINSIDEKSMTALHYAVNNFYVYRAEPLNLVKKLLDCGANIEARDKNGRTPLMLATEQSRKATVIGGGDLLRFLQMEAKKSDYQTSVLTMHDRAIHIDEAKAVKLMTEADIQDFSLASGRDKEHIVTKQIQVPHFGSLTAETVFGAASLSKPVFSKLVLTLHGIDGFSLHDSKLNDIFSFNEFCKQQGIKWENTSDNLERVQRFTADMALSHTTGLPIGYNEKNGSLKLDFEPSNGFAYSGIALMYLQKCIEVKFNSSLESLAKKYVFGPSEMTNSSFYPTYGLSLLTDKSRKKDNIYISAEADGLRYEVILNGELKIKTVAWSDLPADFPKTTKEIIASPETYLSTILDQTSSHGHTPKANAANSLHTTPTDYVRFCLDWVNDNSDVMQAAFKPKVSMTKDPWAAREHVPRDTLKHLAWGHGWLLETDDTGKVVSASHTGDMNEWRAGIKIDLESKSVTVFQSKSDSQNGHLLQDEVFGPSHALDYFFKKFVFARTIDELKTDWRDKPSWGAKRKGIANDELPTWQVNLIAQILNSLQHYYCLPDQFDEQKDSLKNSLTDKCKELNNTLLKDIYYKPPHSPGMYAAFVMQMNAVLYRFDPHLALEYNPAFISEMHDGHKIQVIGGAAKFDFSSGTPKEKLEEWNKDEQDNPTTRNFGFIEHQGPPGTLPANVGYVNISHLIDPQEGASEIEDKYRRGPNAIKKLKEVMEQFRDKDAIILDLSVTPYGGSPEMVQNIISYFMPTGTPINTIHDRLAGSVVFYRSIETPFKMLDKSIAVIVGPNTFSGREEIAYDLQQYNKILKKNRFTIIGQPTKGGAHPECSFPLVDVTSGQLNDALVLRVPYARSVNPVSGTNWEEQEKKGVQPDIFVESKNALTVAVKHLGMQLKRESSSATLSSIATLYLTLADAGHTENAAENPTVIASTWHQQELDELHKILSSFWQNTILQNNHDKINGFKNSLKSMRYPKDIQWEKHVDNIFLDATAKTIKFDEFFNSLKSESSAIRYMNDVEKLVEFPGHRPSSIKENIDQIPRYMQAKNISASVALNTPTQQAMIKSSESSHPEVYAMHSVGKVFTGMLVLVLIHQDILDPAKLDQPIELDEHDRQKLPPKVREFLEKEKITLHQLMTHHGGLGDYLGDYFTAIDTKNGASTKEPADFLDYAEDKTYGRAVKLVHYSPSKHELDSLKENTYFLRKKDNKWSLTYYDIENKKMIDVELSKIPGLEDVLKKIPASASIDEINKRNLASTQEAITLIKQHHPMSPYSNLGLLLVGLACKHACQQYDPAQFSSSTYEEILKKYVTGTENADLTHFSVQAPRDGTARYNPHDPVALHVNGSPAGGYWTTAEDLAKFGRWIHQQCADPKFMALVKKYGQEFYREDRHSIEHSGGIPSSSAYLFVSLQSGAVVSALSDQPNVAGEIVSAICKNIADFQTSAVKDDASKKSPLQPTRF